MKIKKLTFHSRTVLSFISVEFLIGIGIDVAGIIPFVQECVNNDIEPSTTPINTNPVTNIVIRRNNGSNDIFIFGFYRF